MNRLIRILIMGVALTAAPMMAHALSAPHTFTCDQCHTAHDNLGTMGFTNLCLNCHNPQVGAMARKTPFSPGDAANPFGNATSARFGQVVQSSHNWAGSDTVPAAGALPPQNSRMIKPAFNGIMTCAKCHAVHGTRQSVANSAPFLRMLNDKDQMCLDCHRPRQTATHISGSHPIQLGYTTLRNKYGYARYTTLFYWPPRVANSANPTAAVQLRGGQIVCQSCHGVHYTDSRSATFDSHSSAFGTFRTPMQPSEGHLLRSDYKGAQANDVNTCNACHKGKMAHNGSSKQQNVQCVDCHAGHVDVADGSKPNTFLIRRFMNISTQYGAVRNKTVYFQYTGAAARPYKDAAGTGVCQGCHSVPTGGSFPPEHELTTAAAKDCNSCHGHSGPSFSGGCSSCHGFPPVQNAAAGPNGYAKAGSYDYATSGAFKNEANAGHPTHAKTPYTFGCAQCHKGNSHNTGGFQDVFTDKNGIIASTGGAVPAYNGAAGTCSNVYCHSNGGPRNAALTMVVTPATVPAWNNGNGAISGCSACHEGTPTTNVHSKHIAKGYGCAVCHSATVSGNTTIATYSNHVNGQKDVAFSGSLASGTTWTNASATCATSKCHGDGRGGAAVTTAKWVDATTGACGTCHLVGNSYQSGTGATMSSNAHDAHLTASYGPASYLGTGIGVCQRCHTYTTDTAASHVNGSIEKITAGGSDCAKCHPGTLPDWTTGSRVACTSCHAATPSTLPNGIQAPYKPQFVSAGHGQAGINFNSSRNCEACHNANSAHISGALGDTKRLTLANDNALCASCHNDAVKVPTVGRRNVKTHYASAVEYGTGSGSADCKVCHDVHGTTNLYGLKTTINGKPILFTNTTTGFITKTPVNGFYNGLCQVCHTKTTVFRNTTTSKAGGPNSHYMDRNCLDCHDHKDKVAFGAPQGACAACHGYPPVAAMTGLGVQGKYSTAKMENYSSGGGAHSVEGHLPFTVVASTDRWTPCTVCHYTGNAQHAKGGLPVKQNFINVQVDPALKFNPDLPITYSGPLNGSKTTGSCSNVACHFQPTPKWGPK